MSLLVHKNFIQKIPPFHLLDTHELELFVSHLDICYFKADVTIMEHNTQPESLYFVIKGLVQELKDDEVISVYGDHEFFDPISLIQNSVKHDFRTTEETLCYAVPANIFKELIYTHESLEGYFFQSISKKLNAGVQSDNSKEFLNFMIARVGDAYLQKPLFCNENTTIFEAVAYMKKEKSSSMIVNRNDGTLGVVTDTDFREKVILQRLSFDDPIGTITSWGLRSIDENEFLFNAQLLQNSYGIKRLVVTSKKDLSHEDSPHIVGVLDLIALTSFFASHSYSVILALDNATTPRELKKASENFIKVIRTLFAKGVKVRYISKMISQLNNKLFGRLFELIAPEALKEQSVLIIMGSEGRGEQILRTDQDNALIIADHCEVPKEEIERFAQEFSEHLIDFGYPPCEGNIMLSNPFWCKKEGDYKETIFEWIHTPNEENLMNLAIFFDAVSVGGDDTLLINTKEYLLSSTHYAPSFYSYFARPILQFETPLGIFANFIVGKKEHKNELDIKKGGIFPIVHGVRSLAIEYGIKETNTVERLKALNNKGVIDRETTSELIESFTFLLGLRLKFRLKKIDSKQKLDNYINPNELNSLEKDLLKDSFKIVDSFKKFTTYHYKLNMLG